MINMVKFGIIGLGTIAKKFAEACNQSEKACLYAVASRSLEKSEKFAQEYGAGKAYDSYDDLLADEEVSAVYISVINTAHYEAVKKSLLAGKAVLCEKPMGISYAQTAELMELAERKNLLLMEGIWTHFLPCIKKVREWVEQEKIGTVKYLDTAFSFYAGVNPESRLYNKELGGGAALDVGSYCLSFLLAFDKSGIDDFHSAVYVGETGVDEMGTLTIRFQDKAVGRGMFGIQARAGDNAQIYGELGYIKLNHFWKCRRAELYNARGECCEVVEDEVENGFVYEIDAFCNAFEDGRTEVEEVSHSLSLTCAKLLDEIRKY